MGIATARSSNRRNADLIVQNETLALACVFRQNCSERHAKYRVLIEVWRTSLLRSEERIEESKRWFYPVALKNLAGTLDQS
jgi:hypothetical protein